jgi:hypothetical protein
MIMSFHVGRRPWRVNYVYAMVKYVLIHVLNAVTLVFRPGVLQSIRTRQSDPLII